MTDINDIYSDITEIVWGKDVVEEIYVDYDICSKSLGNICDESEYFST